MSKLKTAFGAAVIAACVFSAAPQQGAAHEVANGAAAVVQTISGAASWYGPKFHGRTTANGERFDMHALTAAHRTLPFGTKVRVVNTDNGEAVVVRINDRGPYAGHRVLDLSRKAAESIGLVNKGVGRVKIEVLQDI